ncbi:MAG: energy-coupling factor transporter ATPase [Firmicutes bacterium]|nr:energy-coupling factor transporter ATPase [Bacillota bacterium]
MVDQAGTPLIALRQVKATYPLPDGTEARALDEVDLTVRSGQWVAIVGANGSGKSTLVKLICGLLLPEAGTVLVSGASTDVLANLPRIRQTIGMVWQEPDDQIVASVVEEEVAFGLEIRQMEPALMQTRVTEALQEAGLIDERMRLPHQLSGGQRQRLVIASALAPDPECLVFDEAMSMIDEAGREAMLLWLKRLHRAGKAIVTVTHDMREVTLADRVVVLDSGCVVADGKPSEILAYGEKLRAWGLQLPFPSAVSIAVQARSHTFQAPTATVQETLSAFDEAVRKRASSTHDLSRANSSRAPLAVLPRIPHGDRASLVTPDAAPVVVQLRHANYVHQAQTPFAHQALFDVSLQVSRGERVAIVGHTGSGKSTLMQLLSGLLVARPGEVSIAGLDPALRADRGDVRKKVGLLFQNPERQLFERFVGEDIAFGPLRQGLTVEQARERVRVAMDAVQLPFALKDRPIHALSGGQKRRVGIAGVLALESELLVLDEPTAGLDPESSEHMLRFLQEYQQAHGVTVILVTHRLEEAARFADRIVVMKAGHLIEDGRTADVLTPERILSWGFPVPDFVALGVGMRERGVDVSCVPPNVSVMADAIAGFLQVQEGGHEDGATTGTVS